MPNNQGLGPFCQSCGMPLTTPEDFGTAEDGFRVNDYCRYCFEDGAFTDPHITMSVMIDKCAATMAKQGVMRRDQAKAVMAQTLPRLKRWRGEPVEGSSGRGGDGPLSMPPAPPRGGERRREQS